MSGGYTWTSDVRHVSVETFFSLVESLKMGGNLRTWCLIGLTADYQKNMGSQTKRGS